MCVRSYFFHCSLNTDISKNDIAPSPPRIPTPSPPPPAYTSRAGRNVRLPRHFADYVPNDETGLPHVPAPRDSPPAAEAPPPPPPVNEPTDFYDTTPDKLGVFRRYKRRPTWLPKSDLLSVADAPGMRREPPDAPPNPEAAPGPHREPSEALPNPGDAADEQREPSSQAPPHLGDAAGRPHNPAPVNELREDAFAPFPDISTAIFMEAYHSGTNLKSEAHENYMMQQLQHPLFDVSALGRIDARTENRRLDSYLKGTLKGSPFKAEDGWNKATVKIRLPVEGHPHASERDAPMMEIPGVYYRRPIEILKSVLKSDAINHFHLSPYEERWTPDPTNPEKTETLYGESYTSKLWRDAQDEVDRLPRAPGNNLERVVIGLMEASDSTHLTNFGDRSVWPWYLSFACQSKYERAKPSSHAMHHLAYIPHVCHSILSFLSCSSVAAWISFRIRRRVPQNHRTVSV